MEKAGLHCRHQLSCNRKIWGVWDNEGNSWYADCCTHYVVRSNCNLARRYTYTISTLVTCELHGTRRQPLRLLCTIVTPLVLFSQTKWGRPSWCHGPWNDWKIWRRPPVMEENRTSQCIPQIKYRNPSTYTVIHIPHSTNGMLGIAIP